MSDQQLVYGPFISRKQAKEQRLVCYYTGKPCSYGHFALRYRSTGHCCKCLRDREINSEKYKKQSPVSGPTLSKHQAKAQNIKFYFSGTPCKRGHLSERLVSNGHCRECVRLDTARDRAILRSTDEGRKKLVEYAAEYHSRKEVKQKKLDKLKDRLATEPAFKMVHLLRKRLYNAVKAAGTKKQCSVMDFLGCTPQELKIYFENLFTDGMNWENMGQWHIDHIRPVASFENPEDPACWHYTNLQPLWAEDNLSKSDNWAEPDSNNEAAS